MPRNLDNLKQEDVRRNLAIIKQYIREQDPDLVIERGPLHDLMMYYSAMFTTANQQDIADAMRAINLGRLAKAPDTAHPVHVDRVMSNWMLTRKSGTASSGLVTVATNKFAGFIVPVGTKFTANGHTFTTREVIHARTTSNHLTAHDRLLVKAGAGMWAITLPVVSTTTGESSNLRYGAALSFEKAFLPTVQRVFAAVDFTGGTDDETNSQMIARLPRHTGGKIWNNRMTCEALLCEHANHQRLTAVSFVGAGDSEMHRDRHGLWPGSTGGHVDAYLKTQGGILTKRVKLRGNVIDSKEDGTIWEIQVDRDTFPGFYFATAVVLNNKACTIVKDNRSIDRDDEDPTIETALEAAYSPYQIAVLYVFEPGEVRKTGTADFDVLLCGQDGILEAQEHLANENHHGPTVDILVKAAIPCFTTVNIEIQARTCPNIDAIKSAVAAHINSTGFSGHLTSTPLIRIVANHLDYTMHIKKITVSGKLRCPDGSVEYLQPGDSLTITTDPAKLVSSKTVGFFQDPNAVHVQIVTVD